jgi:hypothetical protein
MTRNVHTLFESQILNAVSNPELLSLVREVFLCSCLNLALLIIFIQSDVLKSLVDIEAEITFLIMLLCPSCNKLPLCLFGFCYHLDHTLGEKFYHAVLNCLFARVPGADGYEAFDKGLQISTARAPYVGGFAFHLIDRVVRAQCTINKLPFTDEYGVEEGGCRRCRKGCIADRSRNVALIKQMIAPQPRNRGGFFCFTADEST